MIAFKGNSLFLPYFHGEGWMQGGKIHALMGENVTYNIENKLEHICGGGENLATWAVFNSPRNINQTQAGNQEWEEESDARGPLFMTYSCHEGESLSPDRNFGKDLIRYLRDTLIENRGKLELRSALLLLPESVGVYMPMNASKSVTIKSTR